jgi:hypothetical protein
MVKNSTFKFRVIFTFSVSLNMKKVYFGMELVCLCSKDKAPPDWPPKTNSRFSRKLYDFDYIRVIYEHHRPK